MGKATFRSNVREIISKYELKEKELQNAKFLAMAAVLRETFLQVNGKYVTQDKYSKESPSGKQVYTTPPGADIDKNISYRNPKTGFKVVAKKKMFIRGKVVNRSGKLRKNLEDMSRLNFQKGSNKSGGLNLVMSENSAKLYSSSDAISALELKGQAGTRNPIAPFKKAFRGAVNIWKQTLKKLLFPSGK